METTPVKSSAREIDSLGQLFVDHSGICSSVCRQIVFALFAIVWAISYHDGLFDFTWGAWVTMGLLVFYLFADVGQYLYTTYACDKLARELRLVRMLMHITPPRKREADYNRIYRKGNRRIGGRTRLLFYAKIILLGFSFIFLIVTLVQRIRRQADTPPVPATQVTTARTAGSGAPA